MIPQLLLAGCIGPDATDDRRALPPLTTPTIDTAVEARPVELRGPETQAKLGAALAWLDGQLVIGSVGFGDYEEFGDSEVYLVDPLVQPPGVTLEPATTLEADTERVLDFSESRIRFGSHLLTPGDVTADGADDLVVFDTDTHSGAGAWLFRGPVGSQAEWVTWRDGISLPGVPRRGTACGDLTGDGQAELCTAAGVALSPIRLPVQAWDVVLSTAPDIEDTRIAAGDLDGDGVRELIVSDPTTSAVHRLTALTPGDEALADRAATTWQAPAPPTHLLADADLDGDGLDDLVAAWGGDTPTVAIATGTEGDLQAAATALAVEATAVDAADLDGDGANDLVVGRSGDVLVFLGPLSPGPLTEADADNVLTGHEVLGEDFGATVLADDMDDDGTAELAVGMPDATSTSLPLSQRTGRVFVFRDPVTFTWDQLQQPVEPLGEPPPEPEPTQTGDTG